MLKAILFDLDDTLIDWSACNLDWQQLERYHLGRVFDYVQAEVHPLDDKEHFFSETILHLLDLWQQAKNTLTAPHLGYAIMEVLQRLGVPAEKLNMQACLDAYGWQARACVEAFPDVLTELPRLQSYGLRFGLVTNAVQPMSLRDVEMAHFGLLSYFEEHARLAAADVGYLKPHPKIFEAILERMQLQPEEVIFIGDNLYADVNGAQQMNIKGVWRASQRQHYAPDDYEDIIPDATIHSLHDLYPILDEWYPGWRGG